MDFAAFPLGTSEQLSPEAAISSLETPQNIEEVIPKDSKETPSSQTWPAQFHIFSASKLILTAENPSSLISVFEYRGLVCLW